MTEFNGTESILVVDDEATLTELAAEILTDAGYAVTTAHDGEEALKYLANGSYDLLFTDIIMPGMTGYRLVKEVETLYPHMKILLTSGYQIRKETNDISPELLEKIVSKPYGDKKLLRAIRLCLDE